MKIYDIVRVNVPYRSNQQLMKNELLPTTVILYRIQQQVINLNKMHMLIDVLRMSALFMTEYNVHRKYNIRVYILKARDENIIGSFIYLHVSDGLNIGRYLWIDA